MKWIVEKSATDSIDWELIVDDWLIKFIVEKSAIDLIVDCQLQLLQS